MFHDDWLTSNYNEGITGGWNYELPPMTGCAAGDPFELPAMAGGPPPWTPGAAYSVLPRPPIQSADLIVGAAYAIECSGYEAAAGFLDDYVGACLAGWPAGTHRIGCGRAIQFVCNPAQESSWLDQPMNSGRHWLIAGAGSDRLNPGEELRQKERITAPSGEGYLTLQTDGNLVIYRPAAGEGPRGAVWSMWTAQPGTTGGVRAVMQTDGNFVVYDYRGVAIFKSNTAGNPGAYLVLQNDGNLVVYSKDGRPLWWTSTAGWHMPDSGGHGFMSSIAHAVSSVVSPITQTVSSAAKTLVDGVRKLNPVAIAKVVAIKAKALAGDIKNSVIFKTLQAAANRALAPALSVIQKIGPVLPYVKSVLAFVPGVGTGVAAAIGAAQSLADGRPITDALVDGARSAIPGGAIGQMAFDTAWGLAHGRPIDSSVLQSVRAQLPAIGQKAFDVATALATAKTAQERKNAIQTAALGAIASNIPAAARPMGPALPSFLEGIA